MSSRSPQSRKTYAASQNWSLDRHQRSMHLLPNQRGAKSLVGALPLAKKRHSRKTCQQIEAVLSHSNRRLLQQNRHIAAADAAACPVLAKADTALHADRSWSLAVALVRTGAVSRPAPAHADHPVLFAVAAYPLLHASPDRVGLSAGRGGRVRALKLVVVD